MSEHDPQVPAGGSRRAKRRRSGCVPMLVVLVIVAVIGVFLVRTIDLKNPFVSAPDDYAGPGSGSTVFTVAGGDTISTMGQNLEQLGVVASADAYVEAAKDDDASSRIQEGVYRLKKEMKASDVVDVLVSGDTEGSNYRISSGQTVEDLVDKLAKASDIGRQKFESALADPASIGLPASAEGKAEGYLAAGDYVFFPDDDAVTILSTMVERTVDNLAKIDFASKAKELGYSEHDVLTIASLVEAEGSILGEAGKAKIARVIYNRLADPTAETVGKLQLDATVNYARGVKEAVPTLAQIDEVADSPYNTYTMTGLPPGPIANPSMDSLTAATAPAKGPWLYYATVNLKSGETKFAVSYAEFLRLKDELDAYCDANPVRCGR